MSDNLICPQCGGKDHEESTCPHCNCAMTDTPEDRATMRRDFERGVYQREESSAGELAATARPEIAEAIRTAPRIAGPDTPMQRTPTGKTPLEGIVEQLRATGDGFLDGVADVLEYKERELTAANERWESLACHHGIRWPHPCDDCERERQERDDSRYQDERKAREEAEASALQWQEACSENLAAWAVAKEQLAQRESVAVALALEQTAKVQDAIPFDATLDDFATAIRALSAPAISAEARRVVEDAERYRTILSHGATADNLVRKGWSKEGFWKKELFEDAIDAAKEKA